MNALFMIVAVDLLLGPLIAIHEFGHYWVARKLGVKVLVYSIGFGPMLLKWQSKNQVFNISFLLCHFLVVMSKCWTSVRATSLKRIYLTLNRQSPWKRIAIVAAGPLINLIFAVLLSLDFIYHSGTVEYPYWQDYAQYSRSV
ncbi:MAG: site-2 protease family protein [Acinetobacter sp.]